MFSRRMSAIVCSMRALWGLRHSKRMVFQTQHVVDLSLARTSWQDLKTT